MPQLELRELRYRVGVLCDKQFTNQLLVVLVVSVHRGTLVRVDLVSGYIPGLYSSTGGFELES